MLYISMVSPIQCGCIWCVLFNVCLLCIAKLTGLVYVVYIDGFFCSMCVHVVCVVYCVLFYFARLVELVYFDIC